MQKFSEVVCRINLKWIELRNNIIVGCPDNEKRRDGLDQFVQVEQTQFGPVL
jgi:hypothetical protein